MLWKFIKYGNTMEWCHHVDICIQNHNYLRPLNLLHAYLMVFNVATWGQTNCCCDVTGKNRSGTHLQIEKKCLRRKTFTFRIPEFSRELIQIRAIILCTTCVENVTQFSMRACNACHRLAIYILADSSAVIVNGSFVDF